MIRGTTPCIKIKVLTQEKLVDMVQIWVTLKSILVEQTYNKDRMDIEETGEGKYIYLHLTQEETLSLHKGMIRVQLRMLDGQGKAYASSIKEFRVGDILKDGVIYE